MNKKMNEKFIIEKKIKDIFINNYHGEILLKQDKNTLKYSIIYNNTKRSFCDHKFDFYEIGNWILYQNEKKIKLKEKFKPQYLCKICSNLNIKKKFINLTGNNNLNVNRINFNKELILKHGVLGIESLKNILKDGNFKSKVIQEGGNIRFRDTISILLSHKEYPASRKDLNYFHRIMSTFYGKTEDDDINYIKSTCSNEYDIYFILKIDQSCVKFEKFYYMKLDKKTIISFNIDELEIYKKNAIRKGIEINSDTFNLVNSPFVFYNNNIDGVIEVTNDPLESTIDSSPVVVTPFNVSTNCIIAILVHLEFLEEATKKVKEYAPHLLSNIYIL
jgi:hypothetical protein